MTDGSGNGTPPNTNDVDATKETWRSTRAEVEHDYPHLAQYGVLNGIEALMIVLDVEADTRHLGGENYLHTTPEDAFPVLYVYLTYTDGKVMLRAGHAER